MGKKKAIKLATATAIAASAFVAVAPTQSEAATSSVDKAITKATKQMAKAYDTYHKAAKNDSKLPATGTIRNQTALAKDYYNKAKAEIAVNGGSKTKKAAYTKTLDSKKHFLDRAQAYVNAINTNLNPAKTSFTKAVEVGKAKQVLAAQTVLNKNIASFEGKVAKIYGPDARNLLLKKYADPATKLADTVNDEMKVYKAYKEIENGFLIEKDVKKAGELIDSVKAEVEKLKAKNTKLAKSLLAAVEKNNAAYEKANSPAVSNITAVNATTVEVTYKEKVKDVEAKDYKIEGLTVTNAAVKQTDDKTVVLTTSTQEGGKEYTVKSGEEKLGLFKGISAVVPTSIKLVSTSVQSQVGKEVTLKADIGQKQAGVAVTFNVDAIGSLNKDQVVEVYTNADGIASYSYTQYAAENDSVTVYPTGAPTVRAFATVYWGVDNTLTVTAADTKGNALNNGETKTYKVTYKNPTTGKPESGKVLNLTFAENVNVTIDKTTKATINGVNPYQLSNGSTPSFVEVTTNALGEATFTVTGTNTQATPVVFLDESSRDNALNASELSVSADTVQFAANQVSHDISITRDGGEEAALNSDNGRKYKVAVKTKDGKVAAGETVNVAFNEDLDREISTNTAAKFTEQDGLAGTRVYKNDKQISVKLNAKGEGEFVVTSAIANDYVTPIAWIDINTSNAVEGNLDNGEAFKIAGKTYFGASKITSGYLTAVNNAGKEVSTFRGTEPANFVFGVKNQSNKEVQATNGIKATYTVVNTGTSDVVVDGDTVSPNRSKTVQVNTTNSSENKISVQSVGDKAASVRVEATATTNDAAATYLGSYTATANFVSTTSVGEQYVGVVQNIDTVNEKVKFASKEAISYKDGTFKENNSTITKAEFERIANGFGNVRVSYTKDAEGKQTFDILSYGGAVTYNTGTLTLNDTIYNGSQTATITVDDADLNASATAADNIDVKVTSSTGAESNVTLTETGVDTGIFTGTQALTSLAEGNFTVAYNDARTALGTAVTVTKTAKLDKTAPGAPTATLSANTILLTGENGATIKYKVAATATSQADLLTGGTTYTSPLGDALVTDGQHLSIVVTDTAGNSSYADYVVTEATAGTITAVTLQP